VEGFKLKDIGRGGQSHNAQAITSGRGRSMASQSSDRCSSAVFQAENHRITESQNHRMFGVGRDLCGSSSPTPLPKQDHLQQKQKTNKLKGGYGYGRSSCMSSGKPACLSSPLKCLYTNARSRGNKQEEIEICMQSQGHDLIVITETWWDNSQDWNAIIDGDINFRQNRSTR